MSLGAWEVELGNETREVAYWQGDTSFGEKEKEKTANKEISQAALLEGRESHQGKENEGLKVPRSRREKRSKKKWKKSPEDSAKISSKG